MIKALLFDFDDTLIKTLETKIHALKHTGKKYYNLDLTDNAIKKLWGKPFKELMTELYQGKEDIEKIIEKYTVERNSFPAPAYEGTVKVLLQLAKKYLLGIITSHTKLYIQKDLQTAGIPMNIFFTIQTEEDTSSHKPNPEVFDHIIKILKKRRINKSQTTYIGDSLSDFFAARDAGLDFYGLIERTTSEADFRRQGAKTIKHLSELLRLLE